MLKQWRISANGKFLVTVEQIVALGVANVLQSHYKDWTIQINYNKETINIKTASNSVYSTRKTLPG